MLRLIVLCAVAVIYVSGMPSGTPTEEMVKQFLEQIPKEDRSNFIKDQVLRGYGKQKSLISITIPEQITMKIYEMYMRGHTLLESEICYPDGTCFDPDDPPIYP